jgi:hypothetical protein
MWLILGVVVIVAALRAGHSTRARYVARGALGVLFVAFGAVVNVLYLLTDLGSFNGFADAAQLDFVRDTWRSLVVPNLEVFIGLLVAFEAVAGLLVVSGGRRTQAGLVALIGFHVGLLTFGWALWAWAVPMIVALSLLLRAERRGVAEAGAPAVPARRRTAHA